MSPDISTLLPRDKSDTKKAEAIVALGYPAVELILAELVEWMQDVNWPVAQVLQPFLASVGTPLAPHVRRVLSATDEVWKHWILYCVVRESPELAASLSTELRRLATLPTPGEIQEDIDALAREILGL